MKHIVFACFVLLAALVGAKDTNLVEKNLWPMPHQVALGTSLLRLPCPSTLFLNATLGSSNAAQSLLTDAFQRWKGVAFPHDDRCNASSSATHSSSSVLVQIHNGTISFPQFGVNESYKLHVPSDDQNVVARILAETVFGAMHALETFAQLIRYRFRDGGSYIVDAAPIIIRDSPRFSHRGVLVDTARHFLPVKLLQRTLDGMAATKLNVLHWHLSDAQSFPLYLEGPLSALANSGAFSKGERYAPQDVSGLVAYAAARGIRVMVEFDTPAHSAALCKGMPEICPTPLCNDTLPFYSANSWTLDFTKNVTFQVVGDVLKQLTLLFPDTFVHLGGDEVLNECWSQRPYILQWLAQRNWTLHDGLFYYVDRVQNEVRELHRGKQLVQWQEVWDHFGPKLPRRTIIQQWLPNSTALPLNVTNHGYRLIWSDSSAWYLDAPWENWKTMYGADPCRGLPPVNCQLVLGGEACLWGEFVDEGDFGPMMWPRAAAVAEKLWSGKVEEDLAAVGRRLRRFRCLLNARGVAAGVTDTPLSGFGPDWPGSCEDQ